MYRAQCDPYSLDSSDFCEHFLTSGQNTFCSPAVWLEYFPQGPSSSTAYFLGSFLCFYIHLYGCWCLLEVICGSRVMYIVMVLEVLPVILLWVNQYRFCLQKSEPPPHQPQPTTVSKHAGTQWQLTSPRSPQPTKTLNINNLVLPCTQPP